MAYRYRAIENGTLANPYRWVRKGSVVTLDEPLDKPSKWLIPEVEADEVLNRKPLPITPYLSNQGKNLQPREANFVPPAPSSSDYIQQMSEVQKFEAMQDQAAALLKAGASQIQPTEKTLVAPADVAPATPAAGASPVVQPGGETTGTANQNVL